MSVEILINRLRSIRWNKGFLVLNFSQKVTEEDLKRLHVATVYMGSREQKNNKARCSDILHEIENCSATIAFPYLCAEYEIFGFNGGVRSKIFKV